MDLRTDLAWAEALRSRGPFGLLMIDVDNFKRYNDRYGHQAGDDCLRTVAATVAGCVEMTNDEGLTKGAFAARYGGEEFAVILPDVSTQAFEYLGAAIVQAVHAKALPHEENSGWGLVTVSVGGARLVTVVGEIVGLFRAADIQLYRAKQEGRNRFCVGDDLGKTGGVA
jgi:diguanylate cyclase (GGDEF)-like protein